MADQVKIANGETGVRGRQYRGLLCRLRPTLVLIVTIALTASAAHAATITVGTTNDTTGTGDCSLRDAITTANGTSVAGSGCPSPTADPSNIINFSVTGTIKLGSTLPSISGNLTITGPITIDGQSTVQPLQVSTTATVDLELLTLTNGKVDPGEGGAISNQGTLTVTDCTFSTNQAIGANGGGSGSGEGGAIFNAGTLTVTNSTFSANQGNGGNGGSNDNGNGGAISNSGTLRVTGSTFSANQGNGGIGGTRNKGDGGAIYNTGALSITNSTFSGNQANGGSGGSGSIGDGGAIFDSGTSTVANSTFSGNQAAEQGGAIFSSGSADLKGTILASSSSGNCSGVTDGGYNIADDTSCNFLSGTTSMVIATTAIGLDPAGLGNHGGLTQTIALQSGSPASDVIPQASCIDADGAPLTIDQRGKSRPDVGEAVCDVGAYEFQESFPGQTGAAKCQGDSVSALARQYGTVEAAAAALGFPSVKALQSAIRAFCQG